jgi:predicted Zn-dependent protease
MDPKTASPPNAIAYSRDGKRLVPPVYDRLPVALLVNSGTASAGESLAGQALVIGSTQLKNGTAQQVATTAAGLGVTTFNNNYSRDYEDQADRVGLRYVYEGGYDYRKAPALWRKFAAKYGDSSEIENFFFGDHSLSTRRAAALDREIQNNYRDPAKDPPTKGIAKAAK